MNIPPEQIRAFIAVRIPGAVIAELVAVQQRLKRELNNVSWTRPEAMHITLQFLGDIESALLPELGVALGRAGESIAAFTVELAGLGSFGDRVLWVGIVRGGEQLGQLAEAVRGATRGFAGRDEERAFSAHVTVGRFRRPARGVSKVLQSIAVPHCGSWPVDGYELIRSELLPNGARHTPLQFFPLAPAFRQDDPGLSTAQESAAKTGRVPSG